MTQDEFTKLVGTYGLFLEQNSGVHSPYDGLFTLLHLTHNAASQIVLTAQYVGDDAKALSDVVDFMHSNGLRVHRSRKRMPSAATISPSAR